MFTPTALRSKILVRFVRAKKNDFLKLGNTASDYFVVTALTIYLKIFFYKVASNIAF